MSEDFDESDAYNDPQPESWQEAYAREVGIPAFGPI